MPDATPTVTTLRSDAIELPDLRVIVTPQKSPPLEAILGVDPILLGTSAECDVIIPDARVSRRHCQLRLTPRGVVVTDLGSKNGTFINDVLVHEAFLTPSAVASLGGVPLTVRVGGAPVVVPLSTSASFGEALGSSVPMRALFARLERAAATSETILLLGESGTGKEVLARAIHAASPRSGGPFVVFDCSAVAPNLIEAELFGYTKGAFTGAQAARAGLLEEASGGTLFLDEIGELPLDLQPKLLRALEARQVRRIGAAAYTSFDARVIAATHRDLQGRIGSGSFREDLYYRLAVVEAVVPPLRERKEDIPLLVERFLAAQVPPRSLADLPPNALELLRGHHWPGNVRELRNTVARLVLFPHLAEEAIVKVAPRPADMGVAQFAALPLREARDMVVEQFERTYIAMKLRDHGGNVARAAASMGVSRQLVHRLMERYGIRSKG
ncbi:AAA family ATPase [Sorangium cellulosum]|nr:AAA family ATPase [Sorangium cellulosum]